MKEKAQPTEENILAGRQLQRIRKYIEMNQKQLAEVLNVSENMVSYYERGIYGIPDDVKRVLYVRYGVDPNIFVLGKSISDENMDKMLNNKSYLRSLSEETFAEHMKVVNEVAYEKLIIESQKSRG